MHTGCLLHAVLHALDISSTILTCFIQQSFFLYKSFLAVQQRQWVRLLKLFVYGVNLQTVLSYINDAVYEVVTWHSFWMKSYIFIWKWHSHSSWCLSTTNMQVSSFFFFSLLPLSLTFNCPIFSFQLQTCKSHLSGVFFSSSSFIYISPSHHQFQVSHQKFCLLSSGKSGCNRAATQPMN